uniref:Uncharacterized protein n=1 Tax=Micrurus corallinus TaxID=54390 RepID=A0A2D4GF77_MICCO
MLKCETNMLKWRLFADNNTLCECRERHRARPICWNVGDYQKHVPIMTYFWPTTKSRVWLCSGSFDLDMEEEEYKMMRSGNTTQCLFCASINTGNTALNK